MPEMSTRSKFEDRIRKKEEEIRELEARVREGRAYIQALQDTVKLLPRDSENGDSGDTELRAGSKTARARDFIKQTAKPVHVSKILEGLGIENTKANRASMSGSIGSYARKGQIFKNFGSNVFGLIGMNGGNHSSRETEDLFTGETDGKK